MPQNPVIVIPGITASNLEDRYPISTEEIWTAVLRKDYDRLTLHPDDLRYEAKEPARVRVGNPFPLAYGDLVEALRYDLSDDPDKPTPVFAFGYDWRKDNFQTAAELALFIDEVLARTCLLPHYKNNPPKKVDLVAHSMGGLVVSTYLRGQQLANEPSRVGKVATIATPFQGSIDAIRKVATGMGYLTGATPRDREREAARMMPALFQLLPAFAGAVTDEHDNPIDLFNVDHWQRSIIDTMQLFIQRIQADINAQDLLARFLASAQALSSAANSLDLSLPDTIDGGQRGWLAIVGLNATTSLNAKIQFIDQKPRFYLPDPANDGAASENTGDGTVPFLGACPKFLSRDQLVGVLPDDLSLWEVQDKAMLAAAGFHATLPNVNLVQRLVIRHLRDSYRADFWGTPVPGVTHGDWPAWIEQKKPPKPSKRVKK